MKTSQSLLNAMSLCTSLLHMKEVFFSLTDTAQKKNLLSDIFGTQKVLEQMSLSDPEAIIAVHDYFVDNNGTKFAYELAKRQVEELKAKSSTGKVTKDLSFEMQVW